MSSAQVRGGRSVDLDVGWQPSEFWPSARSECHHQTVESDAEVSADTTADTNADTPAKGSDPVVLVIMGVSGCGKSTVAALLAGQLGWPFEEGDSLHPQANVDKMAAGHPLDDEDRWPWLEKVADWVEGCLDADRSGIVTCSALKRSYREIVGRRGSGIEFVYLAGSRELIAARLAARQGHFMPPDLLESQFATLEEPEPDEPSLRVEVGPPAPTIAAEILDRLRLEPSTSRPSTSGNVAS